MVPRDVRSALRAALDPSPVPELGPGDRLAAVLALWVEAPEPSLVFTVRAADLSRHPGEISFPGGLQDPGESLERTALRESFEEIGIDPAAPEVLGALTPVHTVVSSIVAVPFVGMLDAMPALRVNDGEIEQVLTFPVARLAAEEGVVEYDRGGGRVWRGWSYDIDGHTVWGATGSMLHELLTIVRKETPWVIQ